MGETTVEILETMFFIPWFYINWCSFESLFTKFANFKLLKFCILTLSGWYCFCLAYRASNDGIAENYSIFYISFLRYCLKNCYYLFNDFLNSFFWLFNIFFFFHIELALGSYSFDKFFNFYIEEKSSILYSYFECIILFLSRLLNIDSILLACCNKF